MKHSPTFSLSTLVENRRETPFAFHLAFEIENGGFKQSFTTPGQYAAIRLRGTKESLFAMSSCPQDDVWSFLVKRGSPLTDLLVKLKPGATAEISPAQGMGFKMEFCRRKNVLLFAAGTGIAPLRSALLWMIEKRKNYRDITLFYGARNPDEFAYTHEFPSWEKKGIEIVQTISNQKNPLWKGLFGHVHHHIADSLKTENTVALVCGMKGMIRQVADRLISLGLPQKNILTNY